MNGWYNRINNIMPVQQPMQQQMPAYSQGFQQAPQQMPQYQATAPNGAMPNGQFSNNPMTRMASIMQAMRNPAAFVRQHLNIPDNIANNPDEILKYMQMNMGVTQADIQNAAAQIPRY